MIKTITVALLSFVCMFGNPQARAQEFNSETGVEQNPCNTMEKLAIAFMSARQSGMPMSEAWSATRSVKIYQSLVIAAYNAPIEPTIAGKEAAVLKFADEVFGSCVEVYYFGME